MPALTHPARSLTGIHLRLCRHPRRLARQARADPLCGKLVCIISPRILYPRTFRKAVGAFRCWIAFGSGDPHSRQSAGSSARDNRILQIRAIPARACLTASQVPISASFTCRPSLYRRSATRQSPPSEDAAPSSYRALSRTAPRLTPCPFAIRILPPVSVRAPRYTRRRMGFIHNPHSLFPPNVTA